MSPLLPLRHRLSSLAVAAASVRQDSATWTQAPLSLLRPASADSSLFHVSLDVSDSPDIAFAHTAAGQYLQLRLPSAAVYKPSFLAIASPPSLTAGRFEFEFLVKRVAGSTAELLCGLKSGDVVEISGVMGRGFEIDRISPPEASQTVIIFATGSGISPIRSLIEFGFSANERPDVRLYYGARNLQRMAYQDRFKNWESMGVKIIPVLSQPDNSWNGERGYVQAIFSRAKQILDASSTAAVLCGQKGMCETNFFFIYKKMEVCITPWQEESNEDDVASGELHKWLERVFVVPPSISKGTIPGVTLDNLEEDNRLWKERATYYKKLILTRAMDDFEM